MKELNCAFITDNLENLVCNCFSFLVSAPPPSKIKSRRRHLRQFPSKVSPPPPRGGYIAIDGKIAAD